MRKSTWIVVMCLGAMGTFCSSCKDKDEGPYEVGPKIDIPPGPTSEVDFCPQR